LKLSASSKPCKDVKGKYTGYFKIDKSPYQEVEFQYDDSGLWLANVEVDDQCNFSWNTLSWQSFDPNSYPTCHGLWSGNVAMTVLDTDFRAFGFLSLPVGLQLPFLDPYGTGTASTLTFGSLGVSLTVRSGQTPTSQRLYHSILKEGSTPLYCF